MKKKKKPFDLNNYVEYLKSWPWQWYVIVATNYVCQESKAITLEQFDALLDTTISLDSQDREFNLDKYLSELFSKATVKVSKAAKKSQIAFKQQLTGKT